MNIYDVIDDPDAVLNLAAEELTYHLRRIQQAGGGGIIVPGLSVMP